MFPKMSYYMRQLFKTVKKKKRYMQRVHEKMYGIVVKVSAQSEHFFSVLKG
jgi:hypothetical protein